MFCKNCGLEISSDAKFCPGCGTAVEDTEVKNEVAFSEKAEENTVSPDVTENQRPNTESNIGNKPDEAEKDTVNTQPAESPSEPKKVDNEAIGNTNESNQSEAAKSENSVTDNIKEVLLPQKRKNGKVKFKDLPKKQKIIRIAIGAGLLLIALIWIISDGVSGAGKAGKSEVVAALYSKTAYPSGMEQAVSMGVYDNISLGDVLDYIFKNPDVSVSRDGDYYFVSISGKYRYSVGSDYVYDGTITYRVSESGSVSVASDPNNITGIIQSVAISMGYNY